MIFIRFADLGSSPIEITGEIAPILISKSLDSEEFSFSSPQIFNLNATALPDGGEFKGEIKAEFEQLCGRCGQMRIRKFNIPVLLVVRKLPPRRSREDDGRYEDDIGISFVEGERFDLEPMLVEQILLSISQFWSEEDCSLPGSRSI